MNFCSNYVYMEPSELERRFHPYYHRGDTNIVEIKFDILKQAEKNMQIGDPIFCSSCRCVLNMYSKIMTYEDYLKLKQRMKLKISRKLELQKNPSAQQ